MSIREVSRKVDVHTRQEIVTLEDDFGTQHKVQLNLLDENEDHDAVVASEKKAMGEREEKFKDKLERRGHNVAELLKPEACKDCE